MAEIMNHRMTQPQILEVNERTFEEEVLKARPTVLVEFSANWSHPCQVLDRVLAEVRATGTGEFKVVRINADDQPELSLWFGIQSIPTLLFFSDGKVRARIVGTASREAILTKLQSLFTGDATAPCPSVNKQLPQP